MKLVLAIATALLAAAAVGAHAGTVPLTFDNRAQANANISSFGIPNTANYGEIITAPEGAVSLTSFGFQTNNLPSTIAFRGEVFAWDAVNQRPTGPNLYESVPTSTSAPGIQTTQFNIPGPGVPVTPGQQYVIFVSTAQDQAGHSGAGVFTATPGNTNPGGHFVFVNSGPDPGLANTVSHTWTSMANDVGFDDTFLVTVPTLSEWAMYGFAGLMALSGLWWIRRRRVA
jgi:hypothetical protein